MTADMAHAIVTLWMALSAAAATTRPRTVEAESFVVPLPDGYTNVSDVVASRGFPRKQVTLQANTVVKGYQPTITFQLAPVWGGTLADLALCKSSAASIAGPAGKIRSARLIDGPAPSGKVCQMHLVLPEGIALITELVSATETWLMTCNHADGDAAAEKVCRATLSAFKFKKPPAGSRAQEPGH
jgi:hypothetical protein